MLSLRTIRARSWRSIPLARTIATSETSAPHSPPQRHGFLPGAPASAITTKLHFFNSVLEQSQIPTYRVLDGSGNIVEGAVEPEIDEAFARRLYHTMNLLPVLDTLLYNVQRQGKISFYMTTHGEEASVVGSAAALGSRDEVLGQYREMGVLLWRDYPLSSVMGQCFSNENDDSTKGRQMPVHFGSPEHHFHTISSPLATQIPQAAGVAYALKRDTERRGKDCAICYFGEGAASEGDFHAGLGMASVLGGPLIFFCRNNGFAISTPTTDQYAGDGIAARGPAYGMDTVRVDGNDVLAVLGAVREARRRAVTGGKAVLVEAMTYRVGHHSTSDDSYAYRARQEVEDWKKIDNPLHRMRRYLETKGWWDAAAEEALKDSQKKIVMEAFRAAENTPKPVLDNIFTDVWDEMPWILKEQKEELREILRKYGDVWEPYKTERVKFRGNGVLEP
ncbi:hypothetical protein BOTBODRAFT_26816 [Botryobasidium botryosum FD-172 SS1]|uniref:2-oxoisovalerate dehydrogenase subunit alpha n=1 Tax=Botryobasidium botryosum (strain FD-172 SS1) TaxID=930990 RepID=A0A067MYW9_BOTB1|nr:hypothetical protein BOTBODRAFT_26816 [Botryobasidium botryosum FD-172 SS1]